MRKYILMALLFFTLAGRTQQTDTTVVSQSDTDTTPNYVISEEDASRNINNILALQNERRAKQKKAAIIRIAVGVGLLVVLVIGLMRIRRTKNIE